MYYIPPDEVSLIGRYSEGKISKIDVMSGPLVNWGNISPSRLVADNSTNLIFIWFGHFVYSILLLSGVLAVYRYVYRQKISFEYIGKSFNITLP